MRLTWSCVICGIRRAPCGCSWRSGGAQLLGWEKGWRPAPEAWKRRSGHPRSDGGKKTFSLGCDSWWSCWFLYRRVVYRSLKTGLYTCCPVRRRNVKPQSDTESAIWRVTAKRCTAVKIDEWSFLMKMASLRASLMKFSALKLSKNVETEK